MKRTILLLLGLWLVTACSGDPDSAIRTSASEAMLLEAGEGVVSITFQTLSGNLSRAMGEGGVPAAIEFCSVEAIPLTKQLSQQADVDIRRASHKPRNPLNRAGSEEMLVIETYLEQIAAGEDLSGRLHHHDDAVTYFAPIRIAATACLQCHGKPGDDITAENLRLIHSLYPDDEATGFSMGELRGIWSVRIPADSVSVLSILEMLDEKR